MVRKQLGGPHKDFRLPWVITSHLVNKVKRTSGREQRQNEAQLFLSLFLVPSLLGQVAGQVASDLKGNERKVLSKGSVSGWEGGL